MWIFRGFMALLILSLAGNVMLGGVVTWQFMSRKLPNYYAVNPEESLTITMSPAKEPFVTGDMVLNFASQAALGTTSYNYFNYEKNLEAVKVFFTDEGYDGYKLALDASGELTKIVSERVVSTGVITGIPVITSQKTLLGNETWNVDIPMIILYEGSTAKIPRKVLVRMLIGRVPTSLTKQGILVSSYSLMDRRG